MTGPAPDAARAGEGHIENWLTQQEGALVESWEGAVDRFYPAEAEVWSVPERQYEALTTRWNTLDAARLVDWASLMGAGDLRVLDLGAGTGWLAAYLSRFEAVRQIDALDSSRRNLEEMLPRLTELMDGRPEKIRPIRGLFYPLPVADGSYDMIVASSAVHHAPSLAAVLRECRRALADKGVMVVLNETPLSTPVSLYRAGKIGLRVALQIASGRYDADSRTVSAGGVLYDTHLGDRAYSLAQWKDAFGQTAWRHEVLRTPLGSYKDSGPRDTRLTHFVLQKAPA